MTGPVFIPDLTLSDALDRRVDAVDPAALRTAEEIVSAVRQRGEAALRSYAVTLDGVSTEADLVFGRSELERAREMLDPEVRRVLERTAERIRLFAQAQRDAIQDLQYPVPGGTAGHRLQPIERVGCYAPGGRYPLPSSMLMTVVTARVAGATTIWAASPRPNPVVLAAAAIAGADGLLGVGGAHAIAALAYGVGGPPQCDIVVGPGGTYVTAAKYVVSRDVRIDMLAGPSELVVVADATADPDIVSADLLAQAEHDPAAVVILVTTDPDLGPRVRVALASQLATLPTADVAARALRAGATIIRHDDEEVIESCNLLAPEHLQLSVADPQTFANRMIHCGGLFVGSSSPEVLGDYGLGPNHVLPTGRTARATAGLSVFTFLRAQTWIRIDDRAGVRAAASDAVALARMEGLEAHARAAERRYRPRQG